MVLRPESCINVDLRKIGCESGSWLGLGFQFRFDIIDVELSGSAATE